MMRNKVLITIAFFIVIVCCSFVKAFSPENSKIQTTFYGCTIAKSTKQDCREALHQRDYTPFIDEANVLVLKDVYLGGHSFEFATFDFQNNVFYAIGFMSTDFNNKSDAYAKMMAIHKSLQRKYNLYKIPGEYTESYGLTDGVSLLLLGISKTDRGYFVRLDYSNNKIHDSIEDEF